MKLFKRFVFSGSILLISLLAPTAVAREGVNGINFNALTVNALTVNGLPDNGYNVDSRAQGLDFSTIGQQALKK